MLTENVYAVLFVISFCVCKASFFFNLKCERGESQ